MADGPRAPKRRDYERIALKAAEASLATQTAAHVVVLEAADDVTDADTALAAAQARRDTAARAHAVAASAFAQLVGHSEAAARLELSTSQLRTMLKTAGRTTTPPADRTVSSPCASPATAPGPADDEQQPVDRAARNS